MLHLVIIIIVCCALSAPSEGIAIIGQKNYISDCFCRSDERVPKAAEVTSIYDVAHEEFSDCVKHKFTLRPSFLYNFIINQYQSKRNNYCSIMDNTLKGKAKKSGLSEKFAYRKRNLLWTYGSIQSLKTLKPCPETASPATPNKANKPIRLSCCILDGKERKRFFALKNTKPLKRKRVKRYARKGGLVSKAGYFKVSASEPGEEIQKPMWKGDYEEKLGLRLHNSKNSGSEKNRDTMQNNQFSYYDVPDPRRHSPDYDSNKQTRNTNPARVKSAIQQRLMNSYFDDVTGYRHPRLNHRFVHKRNREKGHRCRMNRRKNLHLMNDPNAENPSNEYDNVEDPERYSKFKKQRIHRIPGKSINEKGFIVKQQSEDYTPESTIKKPFLNRKMEKETPVVDYDFSDYDETQDADPDLPLKHKTPSASHNNRLKYEYSGNAPLKRLKLHKEFQNPIARRVPPSLKKSLLLNKMDREKKCCCGKSSKARLGTHRCWKSAPLLCVPYIKKGQNDLIRYLIKVMQKMVGKSDIKRNQIFENTKFKPSLKKHIQSEELCPTIGNDDDYDDYYDDYDSGCASCDIKVATSSPTQSPCCACRHPATEKPCITTTEHKCTQETSPVSYHLPNLNQIYSETTPHSTVAYFSSLSTFSLPEHIPTVSFTPKMDLEFLSSRPTTAPMLLPTTKEPAYAPPPKNNADVTNIEFATFSLKKFSPDFDKVQTEPQPYTYSLNSEQFQLEEQTSKKFFPVTRDDQQDYNIFNYSRATEASILSTTSNEPFLFNLPNFENNEKNENTSPFDTANGTYPAYELYSTTDLDYDFDIDLKNVATISQKKPKEGFHRSSIKVKRRKNKRLLHKTPAKMWSPVEYEVPTEPPDDEMRLDKRMQGSHRNGKSVKHINRKSRRYKREGDYSADDFVNYEEYLDDLNNADKDSENIIIDKKSNESIANITNDDYSWTPLKFEMFSDLAKMVTALQTDGTIFSTESSEVTFEDKTTEESYTEKQESGSTKGTTSTSESDTTTLETSLATDASISETSKSTTMATTSTFTKETTSKIKAAAKEKEKVQKNHVAHSAEKNTKGELAKEEKLVGGSTKALEETEDSQTAATVGIAYIVKGVKKQTVKPSPKIYTKIFPDSLHDEHRKTHPTSAVETATTRRNPLHKGTPIPALLISDVRLQLLAVCEGYLEVLKLMKSENHTLAEELESDLAKYCESIISQSFSGKTELPKPKKAEVSSSLKDDKEEPQKTPKKEDKVKEDKPKEDKPKEDKPKEDTLKEDKVKEDKLQEDKLKEDKLKDDKLKEDKLKEDKLKEDKLKEDKLKEDKLKEDKLKEDKLKEDKLKEDKLKEDKLKEDKLKGDKSKDEIKPYTPSFDDSLFGKGYEKKLKLEGERFNETSDDVSVRKKTHKSNKKKKCRKKKKQNKTDEGEDFLNRGMTKEQVELLKLFKKKKTALLNWLLSSKEVKLQPDMGEIADFDNDNELGSEVFKLAPNSGTARPKGAKTYRKATKPPDSANYSIYPIYAKEYGYDKGGELRQVEVLWRTVNNQTHEKKVFKNQSVLSLLLVPTPPPKSTESDRLFDLNAYFNEDKIDLGKVGDYTSDQSSEEELEMSTTTTVKETTTTTVRTTIPSGDIHNTVVYVNKPDPSSIIGNISSSNKTNTTKVPKNIRKALKMGKLNTAKEVVEEYTIEFWNYAVYILPIMFSILFLFCCACCAMNIWRKRKRKKKKKKKKISSTEETLTSETDSGSKSKKRREKTKKLRSVWNALKKKNNDKADSENNEESNPPERKRNFLRFLKGKKNEKVDETSSVPYSALPESDEPDTQSEVNKEVQLEVHKTEVFKNHSETRRGKQGEAHKNKKADAQEEENQNEVDDRRELISLLEELKEIELEQVGEKKEQKSVHVQYMIQNENVSPYRRIKVPDQTNVFDFPKGYAFYSKTFPFHDSEKYEIYKDVGEMDQLLPREYGYYGKRQNYFRDGGFPVKEDNRCEEIIKIIRDAGTRRHKISKVKELTDKDRNFIFEKYRGGDTRDERKLAKEAGFAENVRDITPFNPSERNQNYWVGNVDDFNGQLTKKKPVRLKDDGVLCRL